MAFAAKRLGQLTTCPLRLWVRITPGTLDSSCKEVIQLAYRDLVDLLRCLFMPEIMHRGAGEVLGLHPPEKAWKNCHYITYTVSVWLKTQQHVIIMFHLHVYQYNFKYQNCYTDQLKERKYKTYQWKPKVKFLLTETNAIFLYSIYNN